MSVQLATNLHVLVERSSTQLVDTRAKKLEKNLNDATEEIARLKTDLEEARGLKKTAEDRASSLKKEMAEKVKEINSLLPNPRLLLRRTYRSSPS
jgi:chromosome segregation ATPase